MSAGEWRLSATVRPAELANRGWVFPFSEMVLVEGKRRRLVGELRLGGRTPAGSALRPAEQFALGVFGFLGGLAGQVPVGENARQCARDVVAVAQVIGQEILGSDGPAPEVVARGGTARVHLSEPGPDQMADGSVDLHGSGHLFVRGLPRAAIVQLRLKRLP